MAQEKLGKQHILDGPVYRVLFAVSIPLMINNLINSFYNLADGLWVAQLSLVEFSATSFVWPPHYLFVSLGIGIAIAGTAIMAQLIGGGDRERAESYATHVFYFCLFFGVLFSVFGTLLAGDIVRWMGAEGELLVHSTTYLRIMMIGLFFEMFYFSFYAILSAQGKTKVSTVISASSAVLNVILDPFFIFERVPLLNVPGLGWGIAGAAWATVLSQVMRVVFGAIAIRSQHNEIRLRIVGVKLTWKQFGELVRMGLPTALGQGSAALGFTLLNSVIAAFGDATIAAFAAVNRIGGFVMQPLSAIGGALTPIVGQNMGAKQFDRVKKFNRAGFRVVLGMSIIGGLILWFVRYPILSVFIREQGAMADEVWRMAIDYMFFNVVMTPFMGYFGAFTGIFSGAGYPRYAAYMSVLRLWGIRLPMIYLFKRFTGLAEYGIWVSMLASNIIIDLFALWLYKRGKWFTEPQTEH
ncbi:MAG: MATE family efflux transporter [Saccharofermentanales bacterium]